MLKDLQVSPADQIDSPNFHPYIVVYRLSDAQEQRIKALTEKANCRCQTAETPDHWFSSAMMLGSSLKIDDVIAFWERQYSISEGD